jgi:protein-S-isoprenylcysteine O-methyltransferase Ste14
VGEPARLEEKDHADVVAMPPLVYLIAVLAGIVAKWLFGGAIAPGSSLRVVAGTAVLLVGVLVGFWFARVFSRSGQDRNPRTPTPALVTDGLYAFSRNPAYVSLTLIQMGIALLLDNAWILAALVPVLILMHYGVILREEAYLERKFGEEFLQYKARVRRWL